MVMHTAVDPGIQSYTDMSNAYRLDVPEYYNFAVDCIGRFAAGPDRLAVTHLALDGSEHSYTFTDLAALSDRLASALRVRGVGQGDRVLVALPRIPAWYVAVLAAMKLGAIAIPCTILLTERDLEYRLRASGAKCTITCDEVAARIDAVAANCPALDVPVIAGGERAGWVSYERAIADAPSGFAPARTRRDDLCIGFFTSGTTAQPKLVVHEHAYPLAHEAFGRFVLQQGPDELVWLPGDNGWAASSYAVFGPWAHGTAIFQHDARGRADAGQILEVLERYPITNLVAVPTLLRMLVATGLDGFRPRALRNTVSGGEAVNPELWDAWRAATGTEIREVFGQSESVVLATTTPPLPFRLGSMGLPAPGQSVAVVDEFGQEAPAGVEGDLAVSINPARRPGLFVGYWGDEERTQTALGGDWYRTGDRAARDEDGYLWYSGRADDIIKTSAYRVSPFEVESVLLEHPAVAEVAVVGSPDPIRGENVKAFVIVRAGHEPTEALAEELLAFSRRQTAAYKCPREVEFVPDLPKTISGKLRRVDLREQEVARLADQRPS
jgi:acyl-coenzyme A synthetase/AMP-(fatty) acid ligase